jgi:hypothetical protein
MSLVWKYHAEGVRFSELSRHEAKHFLGCLFSRLWKYMPEVTCSSCGRSVAFMLETKNPAERPGSSGGSAQ